MSRFIYSLCFYLLMPLVLIRLLYRIWRAPAYANRFAERFGFFKDPKLGRSIWVHAVSVGEAIAAAPMIRELQQRYPDHAMVVTTMTPTGSERVKAMFGDSVFHVYAPYDLPDAVWRFLRKLRPEVAIIMETELWPNLVAGCHRRGISVILANARLSEKSLQGYRRIRRLTASMLSQLTKVVAQFPEDGRRFVSLGLDESKLLIGGSIKFDIDIPVELREQAARERNSWQGEEGRPVWIAASTHEGEDESILLAHRRMMQAYPALLLLLVPRHPERFDRIAEMAAEYDFQVALRSQNQPITDETQILLCDTMGEMLLLLGCADVAFVGGSFIPKGGHNTLEPAAWGLPIVTGPSDYNFAEISRQLQASGGQQVAQSAAELTELVEELLGSEEQRAQRGQAALAVVEANRGAIDTLLAEVDRLL